MVKTLLLHYLLRETWTHVIFAMMVYHIECTSLLFDEGHLDPNKDQFVRAM